MVQVASVLALVLLQQVEAGVRVEVLALEAMQQVVVASVLLQPDEKMRVEMLAQVFQLV